MFNADTDLVLLRFVVVLIGIVSPFRIFLCGIFSPEMGSESGKLIVLRCRFPPKVANFWNTAVREAVICGLMGKAGRILPTAIRRATSAMSPRLSARKAGPVQLLFR